MFKKIFMVWVVIVTHISFVHASDRLGDVKEDFDKAIHTSNFGYLLDPETKEIPHEQDHDSQNSNLERAAQALMQSLGIGRQNIFTPQQLHQRQEEFNTTLYHALNAAISQMSDYLNDVQNDNSLEWTQRHSYCFDKTTGTRYPLEGNCYISSIEIDGNSTDIIFENAYLYGIKQQELCLEFTHLWTIFVFWKKTMFPNDNIQSYSSLDTHALKNQVKALLTAYQQKCNNPNTNIDKENKAVDHCPLTIFDMLSNIHAALPTEIKHYMKIKRKHKEFHIGSRIKNKEKTIERKKEKYDKSMLEFISCYTGLKKQINSLDINLDKLKKDYKKFQNYQFPKSQGGYIKFSHASLDFAKLVPTISKPLSLNVSSQAKSGPSPSLLMEEDPEEVMKEKRGEESEGEPEDIIIYNEAYWKEEHQRHQERKKSALPFIADASQAQENDYEARVKAFLKNNIYHHVKMNSRKLIEELKKLKFNVTQNRSGKGSLHYVSPTEDNPLFGSSENYAGAYFNVHLPHKDGDIIPPDYFRYMKSGFSNVFGLRPDS